MFIFGGGSLARSIPGARHMAKVIDGGSLRVAASYCTDFKEPAEGLEGIRASLDYMPNAKKRLSATTRSVIAKAAAVEFKVDGDCRDCD